MKLNFFGRIVFASVWLAGLAHAQTNLLKDLNPAYQFGFESYGEPNDAVASQGFVYFTMETDNEGREPWRTDGTPEGTFLLKDVEPGRQTSSPYPAMDVEGQSFFFANNPGLGYGLWKSDGTVPGTRFIKDVNPTGDSYPGETASANHLFFFVVDDGVHGCEVWRSDGTPEGTFLPKDTDPNTDSFSCPSHLFSFNGFIYYYNNLGELWKSDGTEAGTVRLATGTVFWDAVNYNGNLYFFDFSDLWKTDGTEGGTVLAESFLDHEFDSDGSGQWRSTVANGVLYFNADDGAHGLELWKTDGTPAGTGMVKDIFPGNPDSRPQALTDVQGTLFFLVSDPNDAGLELWKTDGTEAGTVKVTDTTGFSSYYLPRFMAAIGNKLYFMNGGNGLGLELWVTDGTPAGMRLVKDVNPGAAGSGDQFQDFRVVGGKLLFIAETASAGREVWASDGTEAGTVQLKDILQGESGSDPTFFVVWNDNLFFAASDDSGKRRLWLTDGTPAGTRVAKELPDNSDASPEQFVQAGDLFYFSAFDGDDYRVWKSDGTGAGTAVLSASNPPGGPFDPEHMTALGSTLFFGANQVDPNGQYSGNELWKTDGANGGTGIVKDFLESYPALNHFKAFGGRMFFTANDGVNGKGLWKSDGTSQGTVLVKPGLVPPMNSLNAGDLHEVGGVLVFAAETPETGRKLWKSDGTTEGTVVLEPLAPASYGGLFGEKMVQVGNTLFFVGNNPDPNESTAFQLWKTDATEAGTVLVKQVGHSFYSPHMQRFTASGELLFFVADDGDHGIELWRSDGTAEGTFLVKDILPGLDTSDPYWLTDANGVLYFSAYDGDHGIELWRSDGTPEGTRLVKDIWPGPVSSHPSDLYQAQGRLFFYASDGDSGLELWTSDGTESGTVLVQDIAPGAYSSEPQEFFQPGAAVRGSIELVFSADDQRKGRELWRGVLPGLPTPTPTPTATATPTGTPTPLAEGDLSVRGPWRTDTGGGEVRVPVVFHSGGTALGAYSASLDYDAALLELVRVEGGAAAEFAAAPVSRDAGGTVRLCGLNDQSLSAPVGETEVAALVFRARAGSGSSALRFHDASFIGAEQGEALALNPIEGRLDVAAAVGSFGLPALLAALLGVVALAWRRPGKLRLGGAALALSLLCVAALAGPRLAAGDVDGDGFVTRADATRVQEALVGLRELTGEEALRADVDGSGGVELLDALRIAQASAGLIEPLPTPTPTPSPTP